MTNKQTTTLVLFAQNYSLRTIAKIYGVSLAAIRGRIKSMSRNHPTEFNNAIVLRNVYKRNKNAIRNIKRLSNSTLKELDEAGEVKKSF